MSAADSAALLRLQLFLQAPISVQCLQVTALRMAQAQESMLLLVDSVYRRPKTQPQRLLQEQRKRLRWLQLRIPAAAFLT